ncbi:response regulator [Sulfurimonas aquatica]|nr:response regulator [Sulfurimonas aquatica]
MFLEYQYEIITVIVLVTGLIIYFLTKKKSSPTKASQKDLEEIIIDPTDEPIKNEVTNSSTSEQEVEEQKSAPENEIQEDLNGSEEGDFDLQKTPNKEENKEIIQQKTIHKRKIIPHGKITKHSFKEFAGKRILVAEDNLINQKVITGLLAGSDIEIIIANDGQEALDILENDSDFSMILMDAHMPRMNGFDATRAIRANPNYDHIVVVALSGDIALDDIRKMQEAGMQEQLQKPLRMESLYEIFYAYCTKEKHQYGDYVEVIMTKELNGDKGLEVCGGDEDFYREILKEFIDTYDNSTQELGELLQSENLKAADKLLLDIIGLTANIGAENLHKIANYIKSALSDTEEKSYLTLVDQYKISLDNLIKDIKEYL